MPAPTPADFSIGKQNLDHIDEFTTSTAPTTTNRLGEVRPTLKQLIDDTVADANASIATQIGDFTAARDAVVASSNQASLAAALASSTVPNGTVTLANATDAEIFGNASTPVDGTAAGDVTYILTQETRSAGVIEKIEVFGKNGGGTFIVRRFTLAGTTATQQGADVNITIVDGLNTKVSGTDFTAIAFNRGEKFAFRAFSTNGKFAVTAAAGNPTPYRAAAGNFTAGTAPAVTATTRLEVRVTVRYANGDAETLVGGVAILNADLDRTGATMRQANRAAPLVTAPTAPGSIGAGFLQLDPRPLRAGRLEQVNVYADAAGSGQFVLAVPTLTGWFIHYLAGLTVAAVGDNTFTAGAGLPHDVYVPHGARAGWWRPLSGGATVQVYTASNTNGLSGFAYYLQNNATPPTVGATLPMTLVNTAQQLNMAVKVRSTNTQKGRRLRKPLHVDTRFAGGVRPGQLVDTGGWTYAAGEATSGTVGITNCLKTTLWTTAHKSTGRVAFKFGDATSVVAVYRDSAGKANAGTLITIDIAAGQLKAHQKFSGTAVSAVYGAPVTIAFTNALSTSRQYEVELKKDGPTETITLWDVAAGESAVIAYDVVNGGGPLDPFQDGIGFMAGSLCVAPTAGSVKVQRMYSTADIRDCRTLFLGDSITRGNQCPWASVWTKRLIDDMGGDGVIAATDGCNLGNMLSRIQHELAQYEPDFVVCLSGTNKDDTVGGDAATLTMWQDRLAQLQRICDDYGVELVLCYVPPAPNAISSTLQQNYNTYLATLANRAIRLDLALTVNHDGVTQDVTKFNADLSHPNAAGGDAMYARAILDAPFILR